MKFYSLLLSLFASILLGMPLISTAFAAEQLPPWPMLFKGTAYLDGQLVDNGVITIKIDDWESRPVSTVNGVFTCSDACLLAGPPGYDYVGKSVTFHLNSKHVAELTFPFPLQGTPSINPVDLFFGDLPVALPTPTPFMLMLVPTPTPFLNQSISAATPTINQLTPTPSSDDLSSPNSSDFFGSSFFYIALIGIIASVILSMVGLMRSRSKPDYQ